MTLLLFLIYSCENPGSLSILVTQLLDIKYLFWKQIKSESHVAKKMLLAACFMLVYYLVYSSTLMVKAICFPETSVDFQRTAWCFIPQRRTFHSYHCEDPKFSLSFDRFHHCPSALQSTKLNNRLCTRIRFLPRREHTLSHYKAQPVNAV
jgi:hypothetical protein